MDDYLLQIYNNFLIPIFALMWLHLFLFLFATAGISYGFTRSKVWRPAREWVSKKHLGTNHIDVDGNPVIRSFFYYWLNNFFTCWYCNGFYCACVTYVFLHYQIYFICYLFTGALFTLICTSFIRKLKDF